MGDKIDIDQLVAMLETLTERFRGTAEVTEDITTSMEKDAVRHAGYARAADGTLTKIQTQSQKRAEIEEKLNKEIEAQFGKEKVLADKRNALYKDQLKSMGYVIDTNGELVKTNIQLNSSQRQQIASLKKADEAARNLEKAQDEFKDNLKKGLGDLGKGLGTFALNLGKGNTGFSTLAPLIDIVANALGGMAKAIPFIGEAAASTIKATAEASKFVLDLMDKNLKTFQELSNSGALVADGMTGMSRQFLESGMTLDGFKKIVKENTTFLAAYGGTVGGGTEKFTSAVGMLTKPGTGALAEAGTGLRRLGLTADDIGENAAAFLQQEIRLGRGRQMNEKELAEGTAKYSKELDALQKVTGLSRQDAQKQRDELMSDSRYRASRDAMIAEGQEDGAKALDAFIMTVKDPELKRGIMDLASGIISTEAAGKAITAYGDSIPGLIDRFKNVKGPEEAVKAFDQAGIDMQEGGKRFKENFGEASKYLDPSALGNYATAADYAAGKFRVSMQEAMETQKKQIAGQDKLTNTTVQAQQSMELLSQKMFELGNKMLPLASDAVDKFTKSLVKLVKWIEDKFGIAPVGATAEDQARAEQRRASEERKEAIKTHGRGSKEAQEAREREAKAKEKVVETQTQAETDRRNKAPSGPGTVAPSMAEQRRAREAQEKRGPQTQGSARRADYAMEADSTTPTDVLNLIKFQGDALGDKAHFDGLNTDVKEKFNAMIAAYGKPVQVNSAYRSLEEQEALYKKSIINGTPGILPDGNPVAKPGSSKHETGRALDLNSADVQALDNMGLLKQFGFKRLAGDPPHIEMARFGGVFKGPDSGYPVMLHGEEAVIPKPQLEQMSNDVDKQSVTTAFSGTTNMVNSSSSDSSTAILKELTSLMEDKFNTMIDKLSDGNDISDKLLRNSMV